MASGHKLKKKVNMRDNGKKGSAKEMDPMSTKMEAIIKGTGKMI